MKKNNYSELKKLFHEMAVLHIRIYLNDNRFLIAPSFSELSAMTDRVSAKYEHLYTTGEL